MDTKLYEQNENFNRNRAIFVLSTVDKIASSQIAENFSLSLEEVENIISTHGKYENLMKE